MAICLSCLSYLNPYCPYDVGTGRWTCSICGYEENATEPAIFDTSSPGRGIAVASNAVEYVQRAAGARDRPGRCCYVFVLDGNIPPAEIRSALRTIRSLFEGHDGAHGNNKHATVGLIVYAKTVSIYQLGLSAGMASADIYSVPQSATVADGVFEQAVEQDDIDGRSYLESVSSGGLDALERCSDAFFDFDADVEEGGMGGAGVLASAAAAPLSNSGAPSSRREFLKKRREERLRREALVANGGLAVQGQHSSTSTRSSVPKRATSRQMRRKRRLDREQWRCTGTAVQLAINIILAADDNVDSTSSGESSLSKQSTGRIILFTNGCPNHGPGSVASPLISSTDGSNNSSVSSAASSTTGNRKGSPRQQRRRAGDVVDPVALAEASEYYHLLGKDAFEAGIGIDIFCSGATSLGVPALQALVGPSDGYTVIHESLSLDAFSSNFRHVMTKTHMSRAREDRDHDGLLNARDESALNKLNGVILDVRTSCFVTPTSIVGPGEVEYDDDRGVLPSERLIFAKGSQCAAALGLTTNNLPSADMLALTLTRLRIGRYDPSMTHTLMAQVNDDIHDIQHLGYTNNHAMFQIIARYTPDCNSLVTRIFTHRLPISQTAHEFVDGIQDEIVSLVLGREAIFRSIVGRGATGDEEITAVDRNRDEKLTEDARKDVFATIHRISSAFRLLGIRPDTMSTSNERSPSSSLDFAFPPQLAQGLRLLYNLKRGPMLGIGPLLSTDDRAVARSLFMRLPLDDCLLLMAPTVWSCRADSDALRNPVLEPVPPVTLSCWDNCILAADQFDHLYVWSGRKTFGSEYDPLREACKNHLLARSQGRFPKPRLLFLKEGDSMSRRLTSRLAPAHGDPPEHQLAYFPALSSLPQSELTTLRDKFRFYDPNADPSFRRWFWEVASASSKAGKEGSSLCE